MNKAILQKTVIVLSICGFVWVWFALKNPRYFPIKDVKIEASYKHVEPQTLQQIIIPFTSQSFFAVNVRRLQRQLRKVPWIYSAMVSRVWPNKLVIKIYEQKPVAIWNGGSLINVDGEIFRPKQGDLPDNLPQLIGHDDQIAQVWRHYQRFAQMVVGLNLQISKLQLFSDRSWVLLLSDGVQIKLGKVDVLQHFERFAQLYPKVIASKIDQLVSVDLRYGNGFAMQWKKRG